MKHLIRVQLEHKTDVIIDIEIPSNKSLEDLHYTIIDSLKLDENEIASFYMTNEEWELLQEIPLFKIDEEDSSMLDMSDITIASVFPKIDSQLLYVYDFLKMWRFLVSYSKETKNKSETIEVINSIGKMPKEAPEIIFKSEKEFDSFKDFDEDFAEEHDEDFGENLEEGFGEEFSEGFGEEFSEDFGEDFDKSNDSEY